VFRISYLVLRAYKFDNLMARGGGAIGPQTYEIGHARGQVHMSF